MATESAADVLPTRSKQPKIVLHQYPTSWDLLGSASPFCTKLEAYMRLCRVDMEVKVSFDKSPKGKSPWIEINSTKMGDSGLIIDHLISLGFDLDSGLSPLERAQSLIARRMLEEHFYWVLAYARWIDDDNWDRVKAEFFKPLPALVRAVAPAFVRRGTRSQVEAQGLGRHNKTEVYSMGCDDVQALSVMLGDGNFFFNKDAPTQLDVVAFSMLYGFTDMPIDTPVKSFIVSKCPNIAAFVKRMHQLLVKIGMTPAVMK
eukprot:TRINITY_DN1518_c0_g1_i2.p1 TRINITY_DN1518_c0_g1~~TRINITY_DN1518_c0_g1_i2.p1  ORF type:complete len:259 (+),score=50.62 TRINITY_DN1518_c0_g1_i2:73-849(+)